MASEGSGDPRLPAYGGACISEVVPAILRRSDPGADALGLLPPEVAAARQVVLLVLDGLGWKQLQENREDAPTLVGMTGGPISSVAPTTTATALASIVTGAPPARHGLVGYRMRVGGDVLNVLRWTTSAGDARSLAVPSTLQPLEPFLGRRPPVVSRTEFIGSGFTEAHLPGVRLVGWRVASSIAVEVGRLLREGEPFVYAYYDGIDKISHEYGLGEHYRMELRATDRLVADLIDCLPPGAALAVVSDHGQVEVPRPAIALEAGIEAELTGMSGEGRFRWLHVVPGATKEVAAAAEQQYGHLAWVRTREELIEGGYFGGPMPSAFAGRLGDVALLAREDVAFLDPADTGPLRLVARHGSLTDAELLVPLLGAVA